MGSLQRSMHNASLLYRKLDPDFFTQLSRPPTATRCAGAKARAVAAKRRITLPAPLPVENCHRIFQFDITRMLEWPLCR